MGLELLECLYWRRGALLYMYCHTLHQRKQWIKKNKDTFLKVPQCAKTEVHLLSIGFASKEAVFSLQCCFWRMLIFCYNLTQCIQEGVRYLMRMLQVRNSVKLNDGVVLHDSATASILSEGKHVASYLRLNCFLLPFAHTRCTLLLPTRHLLRHSSADNDVHR